MFRGYILTKGKRPLESLKNGDYKDLEEVVNENGYGGILNEDIILVDVDNMEDAKLIEFIVEETGVACNKIHTTKGIHFYFKRPVKLTKNKTAICNVLGIPVDIKCGNNITCIPLKLNGELRKQEFIEEIDELPKWLYTFNSKKEAVDFSDLTGERNQTLFNYILKLQKLGLQKEDVKEVIKIINDYILEEPLETSEINTILREDSFLDETFYSEDGKFQHTELGDFLIEQHRIISVNNVLHIYNGMIYNFDTTEIERKMIGAIKVIKRNQRAEVLDYVRIMAKPREVTHEKLICVGNGVIDTYTKELLPFNDNFVFTSQIPTNYNANAYDENVDKVLDKVSCGNPLVREQIIEMFACSVARASIGQCFILLGEGSNGKSTILDMLRLMIGKKNCSSLDIKDLNHQFRPSNLYGKLANIGDDIGADYISVTGNFKKIITGETLTLERKGKDSFDAEVFATLIYACNEVPRINDKSDGLMRRLTFIPFNARFSNKDSDYDPHIKAKLQSESALEYILKLAVDKLQVLENTGRVFTVSEESREIKEEYAEMINPMLVWFKETTEEGILNQISDEVYRKYTIWCVDNGNQAESKAKLSRFLKKLNIVTKVSKVDGKLFRLYVRV